MSQITDKSHFKLIAGKPKTELRVGAKKLDMATTTLNVTVYGGAAPIDIEVTLYFGSQIILNFARPQSFSYIFDNLDPGVYDMFIAGKNPVSASGATRCELTTDQIVLHPPDDSPIIKTGYAYLVEFFFSV